MHAEALQLSDILITNQLKLRPKRLADISLELATLRDINQQIGQRSTELLARLSGAAASICQAGSAGISIIRTLSSQETFCWDTVSGMASDLIGGTAPRHDSPCGISVKHKEPQLFLHPQRYFGWMQAFSLPVVELLVVPIYRSNTKPLGTIWILSHDESRRFDREDVRILRELAGFVPTAMDILEQRRARTAA